MHEPLVMIPGLMSDARLFLPQMVRLGAERHCHVCIAAQGETVEQMSEALMAGLPDKFALIGHGLGGDIALDLGISSAVLCSLFADRRAELEDDLPASETDPRGWCLEPTDDRWGSRLWLLERGKATTETVALARTAALQALAWLIEDGIAETVDALDDDLIAGFETGLHRLEIAVGWPEHEIGRAHV